MDAHRHQRVKQVFAIVSEAPPSERTTLLDAQCLGDTELRREVESLLNHLDSPQVDFDLAAVNVKAFFAKQGTHRLPFERIGSYRLLGLLGEGGMGVVYLAEQEMPRRTVALKVIRPGCMSADTLRRFQHETEVLGRLQHPGIAQIYDAGAADAGFGLQPFFAMEYVRGRTLIDHANTMRLGTRERLQLLVRICEAVDHAHEQGIIHRDLKPANILVIEDTTALQTSIGRSVGQPKILDFGIARSTDSDLHATTLRTEVGQLIGTIPYMSPEQINGDRHRVDARSDVYALGVIGHELLTGQLPHDLRGRSIPEAVRIIEERPPSSLSSISRVFRGDLDTIFSKAISKDRERRYATAAELGADIARYLDHHPIIARRPSYTYRCKQFAKRHRALVAAGALTFLILVSAVIAISIYAARAVSARDDAVLMQSLLAGQTRAAEQRAEEARRQAYRANIATVDASLQVHDIRTARNCLEQVDPNLRGTWEWRYYNSQLDDSVAVLHDTSHAVYSARFSSDGARIACASWNNVVQIWDVASRSLTAKLQGHTGPVQWVDFHPRANLIISASADKSLRLWDLESNQAIWAIHDFAKHVTCAAFSPQGDWIAAACGDGTVRTIDSQTGQTLLVLAGHTSAVQSVSISPDGQFIASASSDATARLWDVKSGQELAVLRDHNRQVRCVAFSPDSRLLATSGDDYTVRLWSVSGEGPQGVLRGHGGAVSCVAFSPDLRHVASGSADTTIRIWDLKQETEVAVLTGHDFQATSVQWSLAGDLVVSSSSDGTTRLWDMDILNHVEVMSGHTDPPFGLIFSTDCKSLYSAATDGSLRAWDASTGFALEAFAGVTAHNSPLAMAANGNLLASAGPDNTAVIRRLELSNHRPVSETPLVGHSQPVSALAFSCDSKYLVTGSNDCSVRVWDSNGGRELLVFRGHASRVCDVKIVPGDKFAISGSIDRVIIVWRIADGREMCRIETGGRLLTSFAISPDGNVVAAALADGTVRMFQRKDGKAIPPDLECGSSVRAVAYSPDGSRIASGNSDGLIHLWDSQTHERIAVLRGHTNSVCSLSFNSHGSQLASGAFDDSIRLWDTEPIGTRLAARRDFEMTRQPE